jgi:hypothetical protein
MGKAQYVIMPGIFMVGNLVHDFIFDVIFMMPFGKEWMYST